MQQGPDARTDNFAGCLSLLELHRQLESLRDEGAHESDKNATILIWCNQHGLLGLVPVLASFIRIDNCIHSRDGGRWLTQTNEPGKEGCVIEIGSGPGLDDQVYSDSLSALSIEPQVAALLEERTWLAAQLAKSRGTDNGRTVSWFNWKSNAHEEMPLSRISDFFVRAESGASQSHCWPPRPHSLHFWPAYGEPVHEIVEWASVFAHAVDSVSESNSAAERAIRSHLVLSGLGQSATPTFVFSPFQDRLQEKRVSSVSVKPTTGWRVFSGCVQPRRPA